MKKSAFELKGTLVRRMASGAILLASAGVITVAVADTAEDAAWTTYNHDFQGTRFNQTETTLSTSNVGGLKVKWTIPTPAPVTGTPVVSSDGFVYAGDMAGNLYALKTNGTLVWSKSIDPSGITASGAVAGNIVVVGALGGNVYGINRSNGSVVWSMRPDSHPVAAIWGS